MWMLLLLCRRGSHGRVLAEERQNPEHDEKITLRVVEYSKHTSSTKSWNVIALFIHLIGHSFNKYFWKTYHTPGVNCH